MPEPHAPSRSPEGPIQERERLRALVLEQAALIEQLRERIQELEARLAQDSHNSRDPPSSRPPLRKPPPRSQRQPSGRQPGGQAGRCGVTRLLVKDVDGDLHWLHVLSTAELTAYFPHPKRTAEALDAFGLLEQFVSVLVHDHWSAYARYQCLHAFCNAHHLRELTAIAETIPRQQWATDMSALLCEANAQVNAARAQGLAMLPAGAVERLQDRYDAILTAAETTNPRRPQRPGTRGRVRQSPPYNLIARLREHRDEVLRFITDLRVPFDNNQTERDLRMPKLKQKAPACFRSETGGEAFAVIRSSLSTLRKQSANLFQSLVPTFPGNPPMPRLG